MKGENLTIKDIAKALDMSYSTVSRALKDSYHISKATREKVQEYAQANHYRPNLMAQSLKNKNSRSIGVLLCSVPNSFFAEVISGIESITYDRGYHVIITQSLESYDRELKNLEHLTWRSVDGLLVSVSTETFDVSHFKKLHDNGTPIVFFDRTTDLFDTHKVIADNSDGSYQATMHLIETGYQRIAHITSSPYISITKERLGGYVRALTEHGIAINNNYIKYCMHGGMISEENEKAIDELLALDIPPDAILTNSDRLTIACFSSLHRRGIKIPDEMAITGFSNFSDPDLFNPSLTTVKQPAFEMGKTAAELIIQLIESKKPVTAFQKIVLPTQLTIRHSSQKIPSKKP